MQKQGHIDHLFPSSLGGLNHVSNRVLSCAKCNEAEKRDEAWQLFIIQKNPDKAILHTRIAKIQEWQKLNKKPTLDQGMLNEIEKLSDQVVTKYNTKVRAARKLNMP